jgi:hypothetical protein
MAGSRRSSSRSAAGIWRRFTSPAINDYIVGAMWRAMARRFPPLRLCGLFCTAHPVFNALVDDLGALFGR